MLVITTGWLTCKYAPWKDSHFPDGSWDGPFWINCMLYFLFGFAVLVDVAGAILIVVGIVLSIYYCISCTYISCKEAKRRSLHEENRELVTENYRTDVGFLHDVDFNLRKVFGSFEPKNAF